MIAVLAQVDALPGPKRQLSLLYRQLQLKAQQTALEVRRLIQEKIETGVTNEHVTAAGTGRKFRNGGPARDCEDR